MGGSGRGSGVGGRGRGCSMDGWRCHLPLCDHDVTLSDVDTSQRVPRRLEEHSQPVLQTCPAHTIAQHNHYSAPPLSSLPRLPSPLPLDVALQVLVGVSRDWAQPVEFKGLCLRAPPSHCLQHLQGEEREAPREITLEQRVTSRGQLLPGQAALHLSSPPVSIVTSAC